MPEESKPTAWICRQEGEEKLETCLISKPPSGKCRVTNIYVNPVTGKMEFEYEDTPVP